MGIILFGSVAQNKSDKYSDVDIFIITKGKHAYSRLNFLQKGTRVDVIFNTISEAKKFLKEDKYNVRRNTSHMFAHGKIVYQSGVGVEQLISIAEENLATKTRYSRGEMLMHLYSVDDFWGDLQRDLKNKDYFSAGLNSQLLVNNLIEIILKKRGYYWLPPKHMSTLLQKAHPAFSKQVATFYTTTTWTTKNKIIKNLMTMVYKLTGPLPAKWTVR